MWIPLRNHSCVYFAIPIMVVFMSPGLAFSEEIEIPSRPTITVQGQGTSSAVPDTVYVVVGVETRDSAADQALSANNRSMESLMETLRRNQIPEKSMQTVNFDISAERAPVRPGDLGPGKVIGYRVSNQVRIKVSKLEILGRLLDELVQGGANTVHGIQFDVDDPQGVEDQARENAIKDARRRAEKIAAAAGVKVGRPLQITEFNYGNGPRPMMARTMAMAADAVPIAQGEQQITASVSIVFELVHVKEAP